MDYFQWCLRTLDANSKSYYRTVLGIRKCNYKKNNKKIGCMLRKLYAFSVCVNISRKNYILSIYTIKNLLDS